MDAPKLKTRFSPIKTNLLSQDNEIINLDLHPITKNQNQKIFQKARHSVQPKNSIPLPTLNVKNEARM